MLHFIFILVGIVAIALVILGLVQAAKRRQALAAWAAKHGLRFAQHKDHYFDDRYPAFKCLRKGGSRYAHNRMFGVFDGLQIAAFDYHYATGSGKNRSHHHFSAVIVQSPILLKPLSIRRENIFDKVGEFFGANDIDFESAEFSSKFCVKSPDKKWAYDVIHQRMMDYLLAAPDFRMQFDLTQVMVWGRRKFTPETFQQAIDHILGIYERLPDYLVKQQKDLVSK